MENETEIYDDPICDECYKCKYFHDDYSNCQGAEEVCFEFIKDSYYNKN